MDDMVFQNNNKNAIYVLNTSYNTYGELGRPNALGYPQLRADEIQNNPRNCSLSRSLHKLKSLRHHSTEMISGLGSNTTESNSSSTTSCSPAAAALQKLFNCSSTAHSCRSINLTNNNNNNCHSNSHRHAHQETGKHEHLVQPQLEYHHLENQMPLSLRSNSNGVLPCVVGSGKKKHSSSTTSVKSTLIAKKTKFWKYLVEEEKWRKHSVENLSTTNCERDWGRSIEKSTSGNRSSVNDNHNTNNTANCIHSSKNNVSPCSADSNGISNWSGNADTNKTSNSNQKSSAELYKEAAQLLGLSCTLCDNCRCLDCQSRYFECDDSDSYSEFSFMDEYYESLHDDVDRNFKDLHSRHFSSPSLHQEQHSQDDNVDQPTSAVLDHCESFNDLSLENSAESED